MRTREKLAKHSNGVTHTLPLRIVKPNVTLAKSSGRACVVVRENWVKRSFSSVTKTNISPNFPLPTPHAHRKYSIRQVMESLKPSAFLIAPLLALPLHLLLRAFLQRLVLFPIACRCGGFVATSNGGALERLFRDPTVVFSTLGQTVLGERQAYKLAERSGQDVESVRRFFDDIGSDKRGEIIEHFLDCSWRFTLHLLACLLLIAGSNNANHVTAAAYLLSVVSVLAAVELFERQGSVLESLWTTLTQHVLA